MRQRVMIAMALALRPELLIADEPTSALDVTVQSQILDLLARLQDDTGMALLLVSHDLGVIAERADEVAVMYAGRVVEHGSRERVIEEAIHPYTQGLLASIPQLDGPRVAELTPIPGVPPNAAELPGGCPFHPRCEHARASCRERLPSLTRAGPGHLVACPVLAPSGPFSAEIHR
jgi:oligopeptide/dipeptide ABC transporter ATP-binding protein